MLDFSPRQINNRFKTIFRTYPVAPDETAFFATVHQNIFTVFQFQINRYHQTAAFFGTIPRIDVNMFGIQAVRTMIGIAVAVNFCSAVFTNKIFFFTLKLAHFNSLSATEKNLVGTIG